MLFIPSIKLDGESQPLPQFDFTLTEYFIGTDLRSS
jgi:hypothetical protein